MATKGIAMTKLNHAQGLIGISFLERAALIPAYRMLAMSARYAVAIALIDDTDSLVAGDYGRDNLESVRAYFVAKRDEFAANGQ
jgi:hypothetical protein